MKTRNIREVKKKFPKISKDTLEETFIQVVTQLGAVNMRVDRLEKTVQGLIYTNADERLMKIESALVLEGELKVGGADDSEEVESEPATFYGSIGIGKKVEFTKKELELLSMVGDNGRVEIGRARLTIAQLSRLLKAIRRKANKMLKEKE